ncbi:MAG: type II toxin-antitoxin system Phd/YefM family antitoxin [Treponema sp.]|nr:type II toxin-antitoxin system Phd/YefM family antitoxin [Candidatus Treponema equifaecale]
MISYARNEIMSSTQLVRQFSSALKSLVDRNVEKIAIIRNNEMEAVIVPIDEYEALKEQAEQLEFLQIAKTIEERKHTKQSEYVSFEDAMKLAGLE